MWVSIAAASSVLVVACTSSPAPNQSSNTTVPSSATVPASGNASGVENLVVSAAVRAQLLAVGARFHGAPVSQYAGLAPGLTFYAYDEATATYWAGAKLVPKIPSGTGPPTQAEVSSQDEGAYTVFMRKAHATKWTAYDTGETGAADVRCPVVVPPAVVQAWGWPSGSCRAPGA